MNYFCYPKKTIEKKLTNQAEVTEKTVESGSSWPGLGFLTAWFKEGYFVRFDKYKIVLADLDADKKNALIEIRDDQYNFLKKFSIALKSTANFYIGSQQYAFTLNDIAHRGTNPFKKAAVFTLQKVKPE